MGSRCRYNMSELCYYKPLTQSDCYTYRLKQILVVRVLYSIQREREREREGERETESYYGDWFVSLAGRVEKSNSSHLLLMLSLLLFLLLMS